MKYIDKYRKELIILGVIIEIILVPLIFKNVISLKNKDNSDNNISNINEVGKQEFGIMYRDNDTDQYKAYSGSIVDAINNSYELNLTNSKCSDGSGAAVTPSSVLSINGSTVTIKSNKTVYCTLYFDLKKIENLCDLCEKYSNMQTCMASEKNNTGKVPNLSPTIQGDMYRYQAAFPECDNKSACDASAKMGNWICFGTTENCGTSDDLIKKYMYRIIGITAEGEIKLIKETGIEEGTVISFVWNDKYKIRGGNAYYCTSGICPDWPDSQLFKRINGTSNGTEKGSGSALSKEWTDIFVDSEAYDYLRSGDGKNGGTNASSWYNLISDHQWLYGDTNDTSALNKYNGDAMYAIESGVTNTTHYTGTYGNVTQETYKWIQTVTAKIGLMYIHDYYYSYYDGIDEGNRGTAGAAEDFTNSWIHTIKDGYGSSGTYEWLMTRDGIYTYDQTVRAKYVSSSGSVFPGDLYMTRVVRPVFYLSSSTKIKDGNGTKTKPFILNVS